MRELLRFIALVTFGFVICAAQAQTAQSAASQKNAIVKLHVSQYEGDVIVRLSFRQPLSNPPLTFSIANPPRVAFDFSDMENRLGRSMQEVSEGALRSLNIIEAGDRTRLVFNLLNMTNPVTRVENDELVINLGTAGIASAAEAASTVTPTFSAMRERAASAAIRDIAFRRGQDGTGRVVIDLEEADTAVDIRPRGDNLVAVFSKTALPAHLRRKLDVVDFGTPVASVDAVAKGDNVLMTITPIGGLWEHNAYQSDNQLVIEVKKVIEDPNKLVQGTRGGYQGDKLSLNFQNVDVRAVLQVIADFTDLNIITSDTVGGSLTLRLKDVPWDQALDIILQAKGLDMRKNGNVIWIAPRDELTAKEKLELESQQHVRELEPVRTEVFQLNYHKAKAVFDMLKTKDQTILSKRGSVVADERSNKLFVTDTGGRLDALRHMIAEIDTPRRQVTIEARIVEADDNFGKNLGARLGFGGFGGDLLLRKAPEDDEVPSIPTHLTPQSAFGGGLADTGWLTGQIEPRPDFFRDQLGVNLPAGSISGNQAGQFSFVLFNKAFDRVLNLEVSALEADGRGKVISSPRVVTADQMDALIEDGVEIPYVTATSSGATAIAFRKAVLSLKVKPQITPDGRVNLSVHVNKDSIGVDTTWGPAINTKNVKTEVLVENGGTVVIGGIYRLDEREDRARIPLLGDLPYVGFFFRNTKKRENKAELLVFLTPKIMNDAVSIR